MYSLVFLYKHHISVININSWSVPFVHSYSGIYYPYLFIMASGKKKRLYSDEYIKYGFISIHINNIERPQCVICLKTLFADSMKPSFSTLFHIKTKHRNRLSVEDDMRCAIANTAPDIKKLASLKQAQPSH